MPATSRVVIVGFDGVQTLDVTGPAEVFAGASRSAVLAPWHPMQRHWQFSRLASPEKALKEFLESAYAAAADAAKWDRAALERR
jgi:putative intracellular protease/amidase